MDICVYHRSKAIYRNIPSRKITCFFKEVKVKRIYILKITIQNKSSKSILLEKEATIQSP